MILAIEKISKQIREGGCGIKGVTVLEKIALGLSRSPFALIEPERWFIRMNEKLTQGECDFLAIPCPICRCERRAIP